MHHLGFRVTRIRPRNYLTSEFLPDARYIQYSLCLQTKQETHCMRLDIS